MLVFPLCCEFRFISRHHVNFVRDGKTYDYDKVVLSCESNPDGVVFQAVPVYGYNVPEWVNSSLRGELIMLEVAEFKTEKGVSIVKFSNVSKAR